MELHFSFVLISFHYGDSLLNVAQKIIQQNIRVYCMIIKLLIAQANIWFKRGDGEEPRTINQFINKKYKNANEQPRYFPQCSYRESLRQ